MTGRRRIAVIGAGMAAARFAQQTLAQAPPGALDLTLYGHEPHAPYNRALLAGVLDGRYPPEALTLPTGGATIRTGTEVVAVDTAAHTLHTASGETHTYDTLVLATGANPVLPPIRNLHTSLIAAPLGHPAPPAAPFGRPASAAAPSAPPLAAPPPWAAGPPPGGGTGGQGGGPSRSRPTPGTPAQPRHRPPTPAKPPARTRTAETPPHADLKQGVHPFRTLSDCTRLAEATATLSTTPRAIVIGGGLLGVSATRALTALGLPTELIHQAPYLMERHLDEQAATTVRRALESMGAAVYTDNRARALHGTTTVTGVELANGHVLSCDLVVLACDLVVLACGVRPRTGLARAAGIEVRRGIVVDDTLATSAPDVYAIGDCTEHRGAVHGVTGPAWAQADTLAARLSGADPYAAYTGAHAAARLTAGALEIAAFGEVTDSAGDALRLADGTRGAYGSYKKLVMRGDRLVGAILVGDLTAIGDLTRTYERGEPLPPRPLDLLTPFPELPELPEGAAL
ncbi:NAD(P)/FAD-dependent oxidoreductase [Streptomyces sp. NPDC087440]|uniref:NAD(P)/FAD-dependent oxidoreductase n=1 Tax=Streptomyces sp. NPDC087440 TaxID=3365790 RepID=UPI0038114DBF